MHFLSNKKTLFLMLLPTFLVYVIYIIGPVCIAFYYSFTKYTGIGSPSFVGLKNYRILISDPLFLVALKNSFIAFGVSFVLLLVGSFVLALLLNVGLKFSNIYKALNFSPAILAPIIAGIIWIFILDPKIGVLNKLLDIIGLGNLQQQWIGGKNLTPYSVGFVFTWRQIGFIATIFLAGLKMIPQEIYESCMIDGANEFQKIIYITIPMLKETFKINIVLIITGSFKIFETVLQLTNGGPNHLSEVLVTYTYQTTFFGGQYGYGMSMAVVAFIITIGLSGIFLYFSMKNTSVNGVK